MSEAELERFRRLQAAIDLAKYTPTTITSEEAKKLLQMPTVNFDEVLQYEDIIRWGSESPMFSENQMEEIKIKAKEYKKECKHEWIATKLIFRDVYDCKHCKIKKEEA